MRVHTDTQTDEAKKGRKKYSCLQLQMEKKFKGWLEFYFIKKKLGSAPFDRVGRETGDTNNFPWPSITTTTNVEGN